MSLLEFTIFGFYLAFLVAGIVTIQMLEASRLQLRGEETEEKFAETSALEEPSSDEASAEEEDLVEEPPSEEAPPFNPETEPYTMTENPMLRHRIVDQEIDMEAVD